MDARQRDPSRGRRAPDAAVPRAGRVHGDRRRRGALGQTRAGGRRCPRRAPRLRAGTLSAHRAGDHYVQDFRGHHPLPRRRARPAQPSARGARPGEPLGSGLALPRHPDLIDRGKAMDPTSSQASILIVDDDPKNRVALRELLQSMGQSVVLAASGEEALRCVLNQDFAVILLDARMPGVDGFEAARLIRERERSRNTPIIFLTGAYEDVHSVFRGYEAGAVDYIVKPLVPEILKSKLSVFVELYNKNAVLIREIAERKRAEEHLRKSEENLRALAAHLQSVREEEGTRIAREIHDELGQSLTGLKMDLTWVANRLPADQRVLAEKMKSMFGLIDGTIPYFSGIADECRAPRERDQDRCRGAGRIRRSRVDRRRQRQRHRGVGDLRPEITGAFGN